MTHTQSLIKLQMKWLQIKKSSNTQPNIEQGRPTKSCGIEQRLECRSVEGSRLSALQCKQAFALIR